jgi:MFS family permease
MSVRTGALYALTVLFLINTLNFFDRMVLGAVSEPIRKEWGLSDVALGWLGTAFTLLYAVVGLPLGHMADRKSRKIILSAGVFVWSVMTAASGLARTFLQLFVLRLGVGVGEAACAPAATSLLGDLYPSAKRARVLSVFMMGLPVGIGLSYFISSQIAHSYGWRAAFYVAGLPGLLCTLAALFVREPARGASEAHSIGEMRREGSPFRLVLCIPTMAWLIASGALFNFNMYAIGSFLAPYLMRFHGVDIRTTGLVAMVVYGLSGIPGLMLGGLAGDAISRKRGHGRLLLGALAMLASAPLLYLALGVPKGDLLTFSLLMGSGCAVMYTYYSMVYPAIHDVIEPSMRGTAMALYFFSMYVLGASLGPVGTGYASDFFTKRAALAGGVTDLLSQQALEPFRAEGLHSAMYLIPALEGVLAVVLFAAATTVTRDMENLQAWMRESAAGRAAVGQPAYAEE